MNDEADEQMQGLERSDWLGILWGAFDAVVVCAVFLLALWAAGVFDSLRRGFAWW
jgi:hypothetical protein